MTPTTLKKAITAAVACAAMLAVGSVQADPPSWAAGGKAEKHQEKERHEGKGDKHREREEHGNRDRDDKGRGKHESHRFSDREREEIHAWYRERARSGHCPPGLAKKHNGCMPPGQAKKWAVGKQLPRDVIYYNLPPAVVVKLGPPPAGQKFVRVANDILRISVGTGMVLDAIEDLGKQ